MSQVVQTFARRPVVGYRLMVLSMVGTGILSFTLWIHHMFATGLSTLALGMTAAASLGIAVPSGIQVLSWIATLWTGRPGGGPRCSSSAASSRSSSWAGSPG